MISDSVTELEVTDAARLDGGADRNRTCDLLIANETLCQLSYDPIHTDGDSVGIHPSIAQLRTMCRSVPRV